ncbi:hypothetical protein BpHYR1_021950 [Brachionus plicatilis]|uniref:Uncharacterized protein n=1 Tax=Brachionus plicatilis TaxID=10195 RepID=A0A3M7PZX1_BRAPC|nr:hypothetical protein BpHYR1_021950 [Brachionus plicatilis]
MVSWEGLIIGKGGLAHFLKWLVQYLKRLLFEFVLELNFQFLKDLVNFKSLINMASNLWVMIVAKFGIEKVFYFLLIIKNA